jgi:hypothetical protein
MVVYVVGTSTIPATEQSVSVFGEAKDIKD